MTTYTKCLKRADQELAHFWDRYKEDIIKGNFMGDPETDSNFVLKEWNRGGLGRAAPGHGNINLEPEEEGLYVVTDLTRYGNHYVAQYYPCFQLGVGEEGVNIPNYNHRFISMRELKGHLKDKVIEDIDWTSDVMTDTGWGDDDEGQFFFYEGYKKKDITPPFINWIENNPLEVK